MKILHVAFALMATPALAGGLGVDVGGASVSAGSSGVSASNTSNGNTTSVSASHSTGSRTTATTSLNVGNQSARAKVGLGATQSGLAGSGKVQINLDGSISLTNGTIIWGKHGKALGKAVGKCTGGIVVSPTEPASLSGQRACIKTSRARIRNGDLIVNLSRATFVSAFE